MGEAAFDVAVVHGQPALLAALATAPALRFGDRSRNVPRVAMTTWESSRMPPALAVPICNGYDGVVVPSEWCRGVVAAGMRDGDIVHAVPHTFDPVFWDPVDTMARTHDRLHFYAMGAWSERKNHLAVVRAFCHAFGGTEARVDLTIYSHGVDETAVKSQMARSGLPVDQLPHIVMSSFHFDDATLLSCHQLGDVFVSASRGEAFGLPCFEASVLGKEIISPAATGEGEYLMTPTGQLAGLRVVDVVPVPYFHGPGSYSIRDGHLAEKVTGVQGMDCRQTWLEPDVIGIARRMTGVYRQWQGGNRFAVTTDRTGLVERFGYDAVAPRLVRVLNHFAKEVLG